MKIAYLILCHTDPMHIRRLAEKVTKGTDNVAFIHIDKKADQKAFHEALDGIPQTHILEDNLSVWWGGFSSVEATIWLLRAALAADAEQPVKAQRLVILQGLDYPIRSNREIDAFFEEHAKTEFILAHNASLSTDKKKIHKYSLYWFLDSRSFFANVVRGLTGLLFLDTGFIPRMKKNYTVDCHGNRMDIYQGCAQISFTRELAEYTVNFYDNNPRVNRYFRTSYAPDESYFHTILYNSHLAPNTPEGGPVDRPYFGDYKNLCYFEYPTTAVLFKDKSEWPKLRDSGFLYFRKASSESKELLDLIDEVHAAQETT